MKFSVIDLIKGSVFFCCVKKLKKDMFKKNISFLCGK